MVNSESSDAAELRSRIARTERSFDRLCSTVVTIAAIAIALLLVIALFTPLGAEDDENGDTYSIVVLAFAGFGFHPDTGEPDLSAVLFSSAFLVLLIVIVAVLITLGAIGGRSVRAKHAGWVIAFAVLLMAGTLGAWVIAGLYESNADSVMGPAVLWLSAGSLIFLLITCLPNARDLWTREGRLSN